MEGGIDFIKRVSPVCTVSRRPHGGGLRHRNARLRGWRSRYLFNGMPGLHTAKPGVISAAFDAGATVELICDLHLHPAAVRLAMQLFGSHAALISDSLCDAPVCRTGTTSSAACP
ncbi:MAG: hypothetical protein ACLUEK_10675 [Oscillospiraceae bacterium]